MPLGRSLLRRMRPQTTRTPRGQARGRKASGDNPVAGTAPRAAGRKQRATEPVGQVVRESQAQPLRASAAHGSFVVDDSGRRYLDFFMGWACGNLGWGQREIAARLRAFRGPGYVSPHFEYGPWDELASALAKVCPGKLTHSFRAVGGTEAVEVALQAAMLATGRQRFASLEGAYHGNSVAARSVGMGGEGLRLLPGCARLKPPLDEEALGRVETLLKKQDVAAFLMEPVVTALGVLVPEPKFMSGLAKLCREHGTLLVMDEVATGFGRTGKLFATEHYGIEPDVLCLGKAITSGHAPLAATVVTRRLADEVAEDLAFYSTFGWHPLAVEAALANLEYLSTHRDRLLRNVEERSRQFEGRLRLMDFGAQAEVRVKGLAVAVHVQDAKQASGIVERCRRDGLLVTNDEEVLQLFPALTIGQRTAARGLDLLEGAIDT